MARYCYEISAVGRFYQAEKADKNIPTTTGVELDDTEKRTVFSVIDIAIAKKRLKDTLSNALQLAH